mmetsp:Transcript_35435/g.81061  ORF Transcript_35435/g.81061 Transcript_35435/m.81061 type:complete len:253 (-) Transcript_35435:137-895(-)
MAAPKYTPASQNDEEKGGLVEDPDDPGGVEKARFGENLQKLCVGQVTIRLPLPWWNPLAIIALLYGFLPWIIPLGFLISFLVEAVPQYAHGWRHGTDWLRENRDIGFYGILLSVVLAIINEGILKPVCKQERPPQTANRYKPGPGEERGKIKHGMPSGHVMNATTIMWWSLLEVALAGPEDEVLKARWCALIWLLMGPVYWARWYNLDHTFNQCLVSAILGTIFGCVAFYVRVQYYGHYERKPPGFGPDPEY